MQTLQSPENSEDVDAIRQDNRRKCGNCGLFQPSDTVAAFRSYPAMRRGYAKRATGQICAGRRIKSRVDSKVSKGHRVTRKTDRDNHNHSKVSKGHRVTRKTDRDNHPKVSTVHRNTRKTDRDNPDGDSQDIHISISPDRRSMK